MPPVTGMMKAYWSSVSNESLPKYFVHVGDTYHPLEIAHDAIETDAEAGGFEFLGCGCPLHVDTACVADERFAHVETKTTEEENELYDR
jgi:hypothetical protein